MQCPERRVIIFSFLLLLFGAGVGVAASPPSYVVTFPMFPHDECAYSGNIVQSFFGGSTQNWSSLTVKIPLLRFYYDPNPAPAVTIFLNGEQIGQPVVVTNSGSPSLCDGYVSYEFTTTTLSSYRPQTINFLTVSSPGALVGALDAELIFTVLKEDAYAIQLEIATDPASPFRVEKRLPGGGQATADLSLGSIFSVHLIKRSTASGGVTIVPLGSSFTLSAGDIAPSFDTDHNLFDTATLVSLSGGVGLGESSQFAAVHLGRASIRMLPLTETNVAPFTLSVNIVAPDALGSSHNEVDARVVQEAHERGIPPQILKGQIRQESPTFDGSEFRYEPCSADYANISRGPAFVNVPPYSLYAMDAARNDAMMTDTVDLRNQLFIPDPANPTGVRNLTHGDANVTAKMIWTASDGSILTPPRNRQNWSGNDCGAFKRWQRNNPNSTSFVDELDFVAQTTTASSYGLFQALYSTALGYRWSVPDPANPGQVSQSPRYLRDTPESLALRHGGSMFVGGTEDVQRYWDQYAPLPTTFASPEEFWDSFKGPLKAYTGGFVRQYGTNIVDIYQFDYLPTQNVQIFK
jgi:hypothetical protein